MPCKFKCSQCGKVIKSKLDGRLKAIRRHYKRQHPKKFEQMIKKGVKARKER